MIVQCCCLAFSSSSFSLYVLWTTLLYLQLSVEANASSKTTTGFFNSELTWNLSRCDESSINSREQCCDRKAPVTEIWKSGSDCKVPCIVGIKTPAKPSISILHLQNAKGDVVSCVELNLDFSKEIRVRFQSIYFKKKCQKLDHEDVIVVSPCDWYYFKITTNGYDPTLSLVDPRCEFPQNNSRNETNPLRLKVNEGRSYTLIEDMSVPFCSIDQALSDPGRATEAPNTVQSEEDVGEGDIAFNIILIVITTVCSILLVTCCSLALHKSIGRRNHQQEVTVSPEDKPQIAIMINQAATSDVQAATSGILLQGDGECPTVLPSSGSRNDYCSPPTPPPPIAVASIHPRKLPGQLIPPTPPQRTVSLKRDEVYSRNSLYEQFLDEE